MAQPTAAQSVRAKQTGEILVNGADRLLVRDRRPNQPVHVFHRLDLRFDDTHIFFTIAEELSSNQPPFYNTVVLEPIS